MSDSSSFHSREPSFESESDSDHEPAPVKAVPTKAATPKKAPQSQASAEPKKQEATPKKSKSSSSYIAPPPAATQKQPPEVDDDHDDRDAANAGYYNPPPPAAYEPASQQQSRTIQQGSGPGAVHTTTRTLSTSEFTMLFRDSIAKGIHIPPEGAGSSGGEGLVYGLAPKRPATAGSAHRAVNSTQKGKGFIDPYNRTRWKNKIVVPSSRSPSRGTASAGRLGSYGQTSTVSRVSAATKLKQQVQRGGGQQGPSATEQQQQETINRLVEELNHLKYDTRAKDEEYNRQRTELSRMQRKMNSQQHEILHNRPEREAQTVETLIHAMQNKVTHLEGSLAKSEDQCHSLRTNAKSAKMAEMSTQSSVYLAESRRLQRQLQDIRTSSNEAERGGALQEAQLTVRHKDSQIAELHERLRGMQDELKTNRANSQAWKRAYEEGNVVVEENRQKVEDLKQAPLEINRLRVELDQSRRAEADTKEELTRLEALHHKKLEIALQNAKSEKRTDYDTILSERDALKNQSDVLQREVETLQRDKHSRVVTDDTAVENRIAAKVKEADLMARDREQTLRAEIQELNALVATKAKENRDLQEKRKEDLEAAKQKEHARQATMISTMGQYEKDRQVENLHQTQERERQLAQQQDALEAEQKKWNNEVQQREDHIKQLEARMKQTEGRVTENQRSEEAQRQQNNRQQHQPPSLQQQQPSSTLVEQTTHTGGGGADTASSTSSNAGIVAAPHPVTTGAPTYQQPTVSPVQNTATTLSSDAGTTLQSTENQHRTNSPTNIHQRKMQPHPAVPNRYTLGAADDTATDITINANVKHDGASGQGGHDVHMSSNSFEMDGVVAESGDIAETDPDPSSEMGSTGPTTTTGNTAAVTPATSTPPAEDEVAKKEPTPPPAQVVVPTPTPSTVADGHSATDSASEQAPPAPPAVVDDTPAAPAKATISVSSSEADPNEEPAPAAPATAAGDASDEQAGAEKVSPSPPTQDEPIKVSSPVEGLPPAPPVKKGAIVGNQGYTQPTDGTASSAVTLPFQEDNTADVQTPKASQTGTTPPMVTSPEGNDQLTEPSDNGDKPVEQVAAGGSANEKTDKTEDESDVDFEATSGSKTPPSQSTPAAVAQPPPVATTPPNAGTDDEIKAGEDTSTADATAEDFGVESDSVSQGSPAASQKSGQPADGASPVMPSKSEEKTEEITFGSASSSSVESTDSDEEGDKPAPKPAAPASASAAKKPVITATAQQKMKPDDEATDTSSVSSVSSGDSTVDDEIEPSDVKPKPAATVPAATAPVASAEPKVVTDPSEFSVDDDGSEDDIPSSEDDG